jgi:molecular chaperone HscA
MLIESIEHAEADVEARFLREWRVEGERLAQNLASSLALDGELLSTEERRAVDGRLEGLRAAIAGADYLAIKAWIESVDGATKEFAERRMNKHVALAMRGQRVEDFAAERVAPPRAAARAGEEPGPER